MKDAENYNQTIFYIAMQMMKENIDIMGEKCIQDHSEEKMKKRKKVIQKRKKLGSSVMEDCLMLNFLDV